MPALLPFLSFLLTWIISASKEQSYRAGLLRAALFTGALLTCITELLSLLHGITFASLALTWGAMVAIELAYIFRRGLHRNLPSPEFGSPGMYAAILTIVAITLFIALLSPPNTWDSMTYHMGRVVHWMQNQSVAHYPTNIIRQLYFAPWAEFAILHLQILSGGEDYFANLVQWSAMIGCIIGVSLIAGQFGGDRRRQTFAAVIAATIPMGILQSSSTQNDLVAAFWLVCFVHFGIEFLRTRQTSCAIPAGIGLGLAILTKGTAYLYGFPFVIWFLMTVTRTGPRQLPKTAIIVLAAVLALNCGHYLRNSALWGNPLAEDIDEVQTARRDIPALCSNMVRNVAANTWTPSPTMNKLQYQAIVRLHDLMGIDPSAQETSLRTAFVPGALSLHEDSAGNALHTVLILLSIPAVLLRARTPSGKLLSGYFLALAAGFLLFCLMLKWQLWITRLQLPGFVLAAPLIAVALPGVDRARITAAFTLLLCITAVPWLFYNASRPLLGAWSIIGSERDALYFANNPELLPYYDQAATMVVNNPYCMQLAVYGDCDAYEYPLWALIRSRKTHLPRIEHVQIQNISQNIPLRHFEPCMKIKLHQTL